MGLLIGFGWVWGCVSVVDRGGIGVVGHGLWWHGGFGAELVGSGGSACVVDGGTVGLFDGSGGSVCVVDCGSMTFFLVLCWFFF